MGLKGVLGAKMGFLWEGSDCWGKPRKLRTWGNEEARVREDRGALRATVLHIWERTVDGFGAKLRGFGWDWSMNDGFG